MIHAAQIAAEPPINANNRQRFIRSPRQRDAATERFGCRQATAVGQNSTIALRLHPASSFGGGLCGLGKQSLGAEHSFPPKIAQGRRWLVFVAVVGLTSTIIAPGTVLASLEAAKRQTSDVMSALGRKRTSQHTRAMSALPPKADIGTQPRNVRFVPKAEVASFTRSPRPRLRTARVGCSTRALWRS
jgi:hypothetical protein